MSHDAKSPALPPNLPPAVLQSVQHHGFELESATITDTGTRRIIRVIVDADHGIELDALAVLSRDIEDIIDNSSLSGAPYTLEVTTRGIDEPLVHERHWRRARGRKVAMVVSGASVTGRIGELAGSAVALVVRGKKGFEVTHVPLATVSNAVVQVEFSPPHPDELALAGGIAGNRPQPGGDGAEPVAAESVEVENRENK